ncbi:MAG TPA: hypothetical protein VLE51_03880 [Candidatus Saccharimonadales bacterium]|nr:hypothetical protein [Candidatus Saccharimonadales bacterium]HSX27504.1 hypothetical protein [Patescibacteria group bacterium]
MAFLSRGGASNASQPLNTMGPAHSGRRKHIDWATRTVRLELFTLLVGTALLLAAVSLYLGFSNNNASSEFDRVSQSKYQALFLNGGVTSGSVLYSTYFGHIVKMTDKYVVLDNIYYLTTDQSSQNGQSNPQLTKLGCQQLHSPYDEMVINRNQVAFWENLKDNGKVVQAIQQYIKQNPNGPNCSATTNQTQSNTNTQATPSSTQNNTAR